MRSDINLSRFLLTDSSLVVTLLWALPSLVPAWSKLNHQVPYKAENELIYILQENGLMTDLGAIKTKTRPLLVGLD